MPPREARYKAVQLLSVLGTFPFFSDRNLLVFPGAIWQQNFTLKCGTKLRNVDTDYTTGRQAGTDRRKRLILPDTATAAK